MSLLCFVSLLLFFLCFRSFFFFGPRLSDRSFIYDYFVGVAIVALYIVDHRSNLDRYDFYMEFIDTFFFLAVS